MSVMGIEGGSTHLAPASDRSGSGASFLSHYPPHSNPRVFDHPVVGRAGGKTYARSERRAQAPCPPHATAICMVPCRLPSLTSMTRTADSER